MEWLSGKRLGGAQGETRTRTPVKAGDFESPSTIFRRNEEQLKNKGKYIIYNYLAHRLRPASLRKSKYA